jgi:hypothetical protein
MRPRGLRLALLLGAILSPVPRAGAALAEVLAAIQESEFRFARTKSNVPFPPLAWVQTRHSSPTDFASTAGGTAPGSFIGKEFSQGLLAPIKWGKQDLVFLGENILVDQLDVESGPYTDQSIVTLTPMAAWLHQANADNMVGSFVAPLFSRDIGHNNVWGTQVWAGVVAMHWRNDRLQWLYGGVYEYSFGQNHIYPYLGLLWAPNPQWALALVFPWPTLSYVPRDRWMLSLAVSPGGSSWVAGTNEPEAVYSVGSWNLMANIGWRMHGKFWLQAGAGMAGLRSLKINVGGEDKAIEAHSTPAYTIAVQFRP